MSIVNQVSKNNVIYDMNDKRTAIVELTNITWNSDVEGSTTIASDDFDKLINAENGIITFSKEGSVISTNIVNKSSSSGFGLVIAQGMLYMDNALNSITIYAQYEGTKPQAITTMISVAEIETGGGSSGDGVPVVAYSGLQWQQEEDMEYVELELTEEDYTTLTTNDVVMIKATDEDNETLYLLNTAIQQEGGSNMYLFGCFNPESMAMAMVAREDDGEGGYIYFGEIYKAKMPSGETTLYDHQIQNCVGTIEVESAMHTNQQFTIRITSDYPSEFVDASGMFGQLLNTPSFTGMIIFTIQETDPDTQETTYYNYKLPILGAIDKDDEKGFVYTDGVDNHILLQSDITTFGTDSRYPI